MEGLSRLVIGSAIGGVIGSAAFLGVEAFMARNASADVFQNRPATVFIQNDELAEKLGTQFLEECEASMRTPSSHVEVTCWGSF